MMKKIAVVCGGYSGESAVSMRSANMVMANIDSNLYVATKIVITRERWFAELDGQEIDVDKNDFSVNKNTFNGVFMIVHGTPGEDGLMQGYFEMIGLPFTTGNVGNMALTFNKKSTTRTLRSMGYTVAKSLTLKSDEPYSATFITHSVGLPCFVKPNCGGSSIGTSKVNQMESLHLALDKAFKEDDHVIIEEFVKGREFTNGVIVVNGKVTALPITEIIPNKEFFDYEAKYEGASEEITPADLDPKITLHIQQTSEDIYKKLDCRGMIRIDYLMREHEIFVIEVNTVPGFSDVSIIPQQAEVAGMSKTALITAVIESCF